MGIQDKRAMLKESYNNPLYFIVYESRSGSTFLANQLVKNGEIAIPPENNMISIILDKYEKDYIASEKDFQRLYKLLREDRKFADLDLQYNEIKDIVEYPLSISNFIVRLMEVYRRNHFSSAKLIVFKKGNYIKHYRAIKHYFPMAKFICLIRDGRAVFNSKKRSIYSGTGKPFLRSPYKAAKKWNKTIRLIRQMEEEIGDDILVIRYEDLIKDTKHYLEMLSYFMGFSGYVQKQKDLAYFVPERYGDLHRNINKSPLVSRIDDWKSKLTKNEIFLYESVAHRQLKDNGYDLWFAPKALKRKSLVVFMYFAFLMQRIRDKVNKKAVHNGCGK